MKTELTIREIYTLLAIYEEDKQYQDRDRWMATKQHLNRHYTDELITLSRMQLIGLHNIHSFILLPKGLDYVTKLQELSIQIITVPVPVGTFK